MLSNAGTRAALVAAMTTARSEGQEFTWRSLDRIFSAAVTGDAVIMAEKLEDDRTDRELARERSPENVARDDDLAWDEAWIAAWQAAWAVVPAYARYDTGRRT